MFALPVRDLLQITINDWNGFWSGLGGGSSGSERSYGRLLSPGAATGGTAADGTAAVGVRATVPQQFQSPCQSEMMDLSRCLSTNDNIQYCQTFSDMLKSCKKNYNLM
ncbi:unnamed protein product [Sphagnum balticum]